MSNPLLDRLAEEASFIRFERLESMAEAVIDVSVRIYELERQVVDMRAALDRFATATVLPTGEVVGLERWWFEEARAALARAADSGTKGE